MPSAIALNRSRAGHVRGDYKVVGPALQKQSRPAVTPLRLFFAAGGGLSGPFGIALLDNDGGIRRVEKQGVVRPLPPQQPRAVGLLRPAPELNPKENADEDPDQHQGRVQPPTRPAGSELIDH